MEKPNWTPFLSSRTFVGTALDVQWSNTAQKSHAGKVFPLGIFHNFCLLNRNEVDISYHEP